MFRKFIISVVLYSFCVEAPFAQDVPEEYNAETMLSFCEGTYEEENADLQSLVCTFRIQGVLSIMGENCASKQVGYDPVPTLMASPPSSNRAARQAFINYMKDNPSDWGLTWYFVLAKAMSEEFPCD